MSWAKVGDEWWSHPKVLPLSLAARGLWVSALSWSCHQRDDMVPAHLLRLVGATTDEADELVSVGLWVEAEGGGWSIHDWSEYQEQSTSEKRAEAGRKGGQAKARNQGKRKQTPSKPDLPDVANALAGTHPFPPHPFPTDPPLDSENHSDKEPAPIAEPSEKQQPDEQTVRRTAALIGRHVAATQAGITNPAAYASKVTRDILEAPDGIDRERITRMLGDGQTPEAIADGWGSDPFGLDLGASPAGGGPDLKALYGDQSKRTWETLDEQRQAPRGDFRAGLAAARSASRHEAVS